MYLTQEYGWAAGCRTSRGDGGAGPSRTSPDTIRGGGYGRACLYPVPVLNIFKRHGALHVWPQQPAAFVGWRGVAAHLQSHGVNEDCALPFLW
jgi:hypothetical protein